MEETVQSLLHIKALAVAGWLILLFTLERLVPAVPFPQRGPAIVYNTALAALNALLSALVTLPVTLIAAAHALHWRSALFDSLFVDLLILDLWIYFWHRANHEIAFLWRFHEVHHLDPFLDSTTALRFHFMEVLFSAIARASVVFLFGISFEAVIIFEALVLLATIFHHSNLRLPPPLEKALARIIITPSIHWMHHHARKKDTDSNYGTFFSFWDLLFRTRSLTQRTVNMAIGVEGLQNARPGFFGLLLWPFRKA